VKIPTLVVVGDADVGGSNHGSQPEVLANRIPGAEFKLLKGQSHGFFSQALEETNAWLRAWVENHRTER